MKKPNKLSHDIIFYKGQPRISCVYKLSFSNGGFYIGGTNDYKKRISVYRHQMNSGKFDCKNVDIENSKSISANIKCLEIASEHENVFTMEEVYLNKYVGTSGCLNKSSYSDKNLGTKWSDEQRAFLSNKMKKITKSPETKARMSAAKRKWSIDTNYKSKAFKNLTQSQIDKRKKSKCRPIEVFDLNGNMIARYDSIKDTAIMVGSYPSSVASVCDGVRASFKGRIFKRVLPKKYKKTS